MLVHETPRAPCAADHGGVRHPRHLWIGYLAVSAGGLAAWLALPPARAGLSLIIQAASIAAVVAGIRINRPATARPWWLMAAALGAFLAADLVGAWMPGPAPPIVYVAGYAPMAAAVVLLVRSGAGGHAVGVLADAAIGAAAVGALQITLIIEPALGAGPLGIETIGLAYPILDVFLLLILVRAGTAGWRLAPYRLLAAALAVAFGADEWFALIHTGYAPGHPVDALWMAATVLAAAGALHPAMRKLPVEASAPERWLRSFRLVLIGAGLLVPPSLTATIEVGDDRDVILVLNAGAVAVALLVLFRIGYLLKRAEGLRSAEHRARAEAEVARAGVLAQNHRLRALDRMKDGVLASVSHEFRSPLTSIRGHLRLVSDQAADVLDDRHMRSLRVIDRSSERLVRLVEDVLLVARMRSGQFELEIGSVDVAAAARECVEAARPAAAARDVVIEQRVGPDLPALVADGARICQVIDNLISNAVKFSDPGSTVVVSVSELAGTVELIVEDSGAGISPVDRVTLFEPFSRGATASARHAPGTGLGLFISKTIVDAHGGVIHLDSAPGEGTRARVGLPLRAAHPVAA
jgi:signal transduction histidine kinase